jgi:hypothetical protein
MLPPSGWFMCLRHTHVFKLSWPEIDTPDPTTQPGRDMKADDVKAAGDYLVSLLIRSHVEFSELWDGSDETEKKLIEGMIPFGYSNGEFESAIDCMQCAIAHLLAWAFIQKIDERGPFSFTICLMPNRHYNAKKYEDITYFDGWKRSYRNESLT